VCTNGRKGIRIGVARSRIFRLLRELMWKWTNWLVQFMSDQTVASHHWTFQCSEEGKVVSALRPAVLRQCGVEALRGYQAEKHLFLGLESMKVWTGMGCIVSCAGSSRGSVRYMSNTRMGGCLLRLSFIGRRGRIVIYALCARKQQNHWSISIVAVAGV